MSAKIPESEAIEIMLAHDMKPLDPYPGCDKPWRCECLNPECGREIFPKLFTTKKRGSGCKYCCKSRRLDHEEAIKILEGRFEPMEPFVNVRTLWKLRCLACGETISMKYNNIQQGQGCGLCYGHKKPTTEEASSFMLSKRAKPLEPYPGRNIIPWKCECLECERIIYPTYCNVRNGQPACGYCTGHNVHPEDAVKDMIDRGFLPLEPYPGASEKWRCKCLTCDDVGITSRDLTVTQGTKCKVCSGNERLTYDKVSDAFWRGGFELIDDFIPGKPKLDCICLLCHKECKKYYSVLRHRKSYFEELRKLYPNGCEEDVCPNCESSYNSEMPSKVYLIEHSEFHAFKVGVMNIGTDRLASHKARGWSLYDNWGFDNGEQALNVETKTLRWLRGEKRVDPFLFPKDMPQSGFSETASLAHISLDEVRIFIQSAAEEYY